ncbi:c-type cytochrome [Sinomicrobium weinanense]|uniref:Cytochrome c n=1 Tax=Sinomicrobium weinanense TaxID=2842200 RepID=A0A926PZY5_9FLAO|nr:cytochrome c [Sinomicrobium weinanense]MBC9794512.1 cytochrome c [Sinomicrobium weinanense]MBU3124419.1 cytochrome c [Sinomicrobium weinanense]
MKKILLTMALGTAMVLVSCGEKKEKKEKFSYERTKTEKKADNAGAEASKVPVDLDNKGIGPIEEVEFGDIDQNMVSQGEEAFKTKCTACHKVDQKFIGPDLQGIYERRSPEWVMNMMLNPDVMQKEDPIAKALVEEYNGTLMLNQNLTEEEARAIAEFLRTL